MIGEQTVSDRSPEKKILPLTFTLEEFPGTAEGVIYRQAFNSQFASRAPVAWQRLLKHQPVAEAFIHTRRAAMCLAGSRSRDLSRASDRLLGQLIRDVTRWALDYNLGVDWLIDTAVITLRVRASYIDHGAEPPQTLCWPGEGMLVNHPEGVDILERAGWLEPFSAIAFDVPAKRLLWVQQEGTFGKFKQQAKRDLDNLLEEQLAEKRSSGVAGLTTPIFVQSSAVDWTIDSYVNGLLPEQIRQRSGASVKSAQTIRDGIQKTVSLIGLPLRRYDERAKRWVLVDPAKDPPASSIAS